VVARYATETTKKKEKKERFNKKIAAEAWGVLTSSQRGQQKWKKDAK